MDYNIDNVPETLNPGDRVLCPYSGTEKTLTLPKGRYKLECWGADGGYAESSQERKAGGTGGYSVGVFCVAQNTQELHLCVGQHGQDVKYTATSFYRAYNGGGKGQTIEVQLVVTWVGSCAGGGGATHIALRSGVLKNLANYQSDVLMVAGGAGGAYTRGGFKARFGGDGGGEVGQTGDHLDEWTDDTMLPGTQTAAGQNAGFGYGADSDTNNHRGGAGGAGWYGGSAGYSNDSGGSAGSGHINDSLMESGGTYRPTATEYLPNPDSAGNGYIIITVLGMLYSAAYNDETLFTAYTGDDSVSVIYDDESIATVGKGQSKTLLTESKVALSDIKIGDKTLNCAGKYFVDDVVVTGHN